MDFSAIKKDTMTGIWTSGSVNDKKGWQLFFLNSACNSWDCCRTASTSPVSWAAWICAICSFTWGFKACRAAALRCTRTTMGRSAKRTSIVVAAMVPHHGNPVVTLMASRNASSAPTGVKLQSPIAFRSPIWATAVCATLLLTGSNTALLLLLLPMVSLEKLRWVIGTITLTGCIACWLCKNDAAGKRRCGVICRTNLMVLGAI